MDKRSRDEDTRTDDNVKGPKTFRRLLIRFADKTSMVGVPYINNARLIGARIIWIILLLIAIAAMGLHLWYLVTQFISFPYTAKVSFGFGNLPLPEVTICNTNPIHKRRLDEYDGADDLKRLIGDMSPEVLAPEQFDDDLYYRKYAEYFNDVGGQFQFNSSALDGVDQTDEDEYSGYDPATYDPNFNDWWNEEERSFDEDEYDGAVDSQSRLYELFQSLFYDLDKDTREQIGHNMDDMLMSCSFNERVCNSSMFRLFQTIKYGNCWTLSNDKFKVLKPGPTGSLSLVLYLETPEYIEGITQGYGAQVEIHEPTTYPDPHESGFHVPAGMETNIGMRMLKIDRIGKPHANCEEGKTFKAFYNRTYTRKSCLQLCRLTKEQESCGCYDDFWDELVYATRTSLKVCETSAQWDCIANIDRMAEQKTLSCTCLNPCSEVTYQKSISVRQWPTEGYSKILLKQLCDRDFEACHTIRTSGTTNNFVKLNIYYESLNFENVKEEADIEIAQFLSDVGGAVGLWIGLSILSICEVFQLIIEIIDLAVHRCRTPNSRRADRKKNIKDRYKYDKDHDERDRRGGAYPYSDFRRDHEYSYPHNDDRSSRFYELENGPYGEKRHDRRY